MSFIYTHIHISEIEKTYVTKQTKKWPPTYARLTHAYKCEEEKEKRTNCLRLDYLFYLFSLSLCKLVYGSVTCPNVLYVSACVWVCERIHKPRLSAHGAHH